MARAKKTTTTEQTYKMPFPTRLRRLLDSPGETQEKLAKGIGANRQSIGQWKDGLTSPDVIVFEKIAKYYNVSADYLIGRIDSKSPMIDNMAIHARTGLSDKAIDVISNFDPEKQKTLSNIIGNDKLGALLSGIDDVVNQKSLYYQYIFEISERLNKADKSAMANISGTSVGYGGAYANARNRNMATDSKEISAKKYIEVLRYSLKNIFEDIINEVTYSKDFDTGVIDGFTQLIRTDDDDLLYKLKTDSLKRFQNDELKGFLGENAGWSKA